MSILRGVLTHFPKKCKFYDVFLKVRTLKYGTVARFFPKKYEKRKRDAPGTFRNPARKIRHLLMKKRKLYDVFLHIYKKEKRQFYDVFDTLAKITSIVRRVLTHARKKM